MREHQECLDAIDAAMAEQRWGWAAYLERRCERRHANLPAFHEPTEESA